MSVSTSLIVIIMFTSIVGIGIGNVLMAFAGSLAQLASLRARQFGAIWMLILLVTFLSMFWNSTTLLNRSEWHFGLFLYVIAGPIILLFASSLMSRLLAMEDSAESDQMRNFIITRFFWYYAAAHAWVIGMDMVIGNDWTKATTFSTLISLAAVALAVWKDPRLRWWFTLAMLVLNVADIVMQSL